MRRAPALIADKTCGRAAGLIEFDPLDRNAVARRYEQFIGEGGALADGGDDFHIEKRPPAADDRSQFVTAGALAADQPNALPSNCTPVLASPAGSKPGDSLHKPAMTTSQASASEG